MQNQKSYDKDKIASFLAKVEKKMNTSNDNVSTNNKDNIKEWIKEVNQVESKTINISYNKECFEKSKLEAESLVNSILDQSKSPENTMKELLDIISKLSKKDYTIPQKEEMLTSLEKNYFSPQNILQKIIDIPQIEKSLVGLLSKTNNKELEFESLNSSLVIASILIKKLITVSSLTVEGNSVPKIETFVNDFTKLIPVLFTYNDFRLRTCLINTIGNITSYMLLYQMESNLQIILSLIFKELSICSNSVIEEFNRILIQQGKKEADTNKEEPHEKDINKMKHLSLDSCKNILIEIINRLPIDSDIFPKIQSLFITYVSSLYSMITNDSNNNIISILVMSYEVLSFYFKLPFYVKHLSMNVDEIKKQILGRIVIHLSTPSPQLRYWIINYLIAFNKNYPLKEDEYFLHNILPLICLNRYLPVDGVKNNSMILWKSIVALNGISIIKNNYECFLKAYIKELSSIGQNEKEAACRCVQELIMKVYEPSQHQDIVKKYYMEMINRIIKCSRDPCYNVRESGLIALSYVYGNIKELIKDDVTLIEDICILIKEHCFDNVIEVRDASAFALKIYHNQGGILDQKYIDYYKTLISELNNTEKMKILYEEIKKEIFTNITSKQDFGFMREVEINEFKDGIIHIIKELCDDKESILYKECSLKIDELIMIVIDFLCKNYRIGLSNLNKKTIWEALSVLIIQINKCDVEMYLDYIVDILLDELENNLNSLSGYQAEKFITKMIEQGISKRMIKGKVRMKIKGKEGLTKLFDKLLK